MNDSFLRYCVFRIFEFLLVSLWIARESSPEIDTFQWKSPAGRWLFFTQIWAFVYRRYFTGSLISVFFSSTVTAGTTFWFLNCNIFECKSAWIFENLHKNILLDEKHPCGAFGLTIRQSKNFSSCFSLLSCCVQRAQRAEIFVFSLGFFFWNGLRTKLEALEIPEISQLSLFRGVVRYIPEKNTGGEVKQPSPKCQLYGHTGVVPLSKWHNVNATLMECQ